MCKIRLHVQNNDNNDNDKNNNHNNDNNDNNDNTNVRIIIRNTFVAL